MLLQRKLRKLEVERFDVSWSRLHSQQGKKPVFTPTPGWLQNAWLSTASPENSIGNPPICLWVSVRPWLEVKIELEELGEEKPVCWPSKGEKKVCSLGLPTLCSTSKHCLLGPAPLEQGPALSRQCLVAWAVHLKLFLLQDPILSWPVCYLVAKSWILDMQRMCWFRNF